MSVCVRAAGHRGPIHSLASPCSALLESQGLPRRGHVSWLLPLSSCTVQNVFTCIDVLLRIGQARDRKAGEAHIEITCGLILQLLATSPKPIAPQTFLFPFRNTSAGARRLVSVSPAVCVALEPVSASLYSFGQLLQVSFGTDRRCDPLLGAFHLGSQTLERRHWKSSV